MNPNACIFIPSLKADPMEQRSVEIEFLSNQIEISKQDLEKSNDELLLLHNELNRKHLALSEQIQRKENNQIPHCTQEQIDFLHEAYNVQLNIYYTKYGKFNDKTSDLVTLQQKLHKLFISQPHVQPTQNHEALDNEQQAAVNPTNAVIDSPSPKATTNPFGKNISIGILDGIDVSRSYSPPSTPHNVLPPIMESDKESLEWNDDEHEEQEPEQPDEAGMCDQATMTMTEETQSEHSTIPSQQPLAVQTEQIEHNQAMEENKEIEHDDQENRYQAVLQGPNGNDMKYKVDEQKWCKSMAVRTARVNVSSTRDVVDYVKLEKDIKGMLSNMMYYDIDTICDEFNEYMDRHYFNRKSIELMINLIICHGVENKPVFFGTKYSLLCQSICDRFGGGNGNGQNQNDDGLDILGLIWKCCYEQFKKLHFGNNGDKFLNVMIIIAELLNANLLTPQFIFDYIFNAILCDSRNEICENDIEGLYEIFKRCSRSLTVDNQYQQYLDKYFVIMDKVKNWKKFQFGMHRVPFMVNQMKILSDRKSKPQFRRIW